MCKDVMQAMEEFHQKVALCRSLNASFIVAISKKIGAEKLTDFRPISLLSSFYKLLAKTLAR